MSTFCALVPLFLFFIGASIGVGISMSKISSADLWANICGGVAAAGFLALVAYLWNRRKHRILKELTEIVGEAIEHRNIGEQGTFADEDEWIREAKAIEIKAIAKAKSLSSTAGSLVEWLDRVEPWSTELDRYTAILSKVITRVQRLLERNS